MTETPIIQQNDDLFLTPADWVSQIPWLRPNSEEIKRTLRYDLTNPSEYEKWLLKKNTE